MFENARLKLTAWYLVIIMTISLLFSLAIYSSISVELQRFEKIPVRILGDFPDGKSVELPARNRLIKVGRPDPTIIDNARRRLIFNLVLLNIVILGLSGAAGYFLAGRTLRPIQKIVDDQKRFVADASHELRTPLTSLRSEIEVGLRNKSLSLVGAKKILKSNLEEVIHLQKLSDNLLELAQNGKQIDQKRFIKIDIKTIVEKAIKKVESVARKKQITIFSTVGSKHIYGIPDRLVEACVIILDNAIKYSGDRSTIKLVLSSKKEFLSLSIADEGIGIATQDLPYVFDRFYRADISRSKVSGYGLGLSIAKAIIVAHGGTIIAQHNHPRGAMISITLPTSYTS